MSEHRETCQPGTVLPTPLYLSHRLEHVHHEHRIRDIPLVVAKEEFRNFLKQLLGYGDFVLSYVPYEYMIAATVTLTKNPLAL